MDKEIFELPDITLDILNSGVEISFVAQVEGYNLDFQVPLDVMASYLGQNSGSTKYTGGTNPDNAIGNNGDVYVQDNGKTYIKSSGAWVLFSSAQKNPIKVPFSGSFYTAPVGYSVFKVSAYLTGTGGFDQPHPEFITGVNETSGQISVDSQGLAGYIVWV